MSNRLLKRRQFVSVRVVLIFPSFSKAYLSGRSKKSSSRAVSEISAVSNRAGIGALAKCLIQMCRSY